MEYYAQVLQELNDLVEEKRRKGCTKGMPPLHTKLLTPSPKLKVYYVNKII